VEVMSSDIQGVCARSQHAQPQVASLTLNGASFQLHLLANHVTAQREYLRLVGTGDAYEPLMIEIITRLLRDRPNAEFMDVGAYVAYFASYVAALHPDLRVSAIESNPRYVRGIEQTIALNGFRNMTVHQAVLSDRRERVSVEREWVVYGSTAPDALETLTLDDLAAQHGFKPSIVKMDVHGAEGKVLLGAQRLLRESIDFLLLELHPVDFLRRYSPGVTRTGILDLLRGLGFTLYYVAGHRYRRSDGLDTFLRTGSFAYQVIDARTQDYLLFDRHVDVFLVASKSPLELVLGPSIPDPSVLG